MQKIYNLLFFIVPDTSHFYLFCQKNRNSITHGTSRSILYMEWTNKVPLNSTEKYIQYREKP